MSLASGMLRMLKHHGSHPLVRVETRPDGHTPDATGWG